MNADQKNRQLSERILKVTGVEVLPSDAGVIRRAAIAIHDWNVDECNGVIQFNEDDKKCHYWAGGRNGGKRYDWGAIKDKETLAINRAKKVTEKYGLTLFHQGDPRGVSLYVGTSEMNEVNYDSFVACHNC
jgi:hypothetical protein